MEDSAPHTSQEGHRGLQASLAPLGADGGGGDLSSYVGPRSQSWTCPGF